jgi:hypothetical protein
MTTNKEMKSETVLTVAQHYYRGGYNVMGLVRYRQAALKNGKKVWVKADLLDDVRPRTGQSDKFVSECRKMAEVLGEPFVLGIRHNQPVLSDVE